MHMHAHTHMYTYTHTHTRTHTHTHTHHTDDDYCPNTSGIKLPIKATAAHVLFFAACDATHVRYALHTEVVRAGFGASTAFARGVFLQV